MTASSPPSEPAATASVTLIGFDPTAKWLADGTGAENLWRRVLPPRSSSGLVLFDDSQLVGAVSQLPSLALPPIGGLIALLIAYIALIGPINYLVLRRLDRREWAWVTMPVLIVVFAVGAYGFGAALRGSDVLVNEVALVRGSPGATDGTAQVYVGVFSPSRGSYQVSVPGGALLSSPHQRGVLRRRQHGRHPRRPAGRPREGPRPRRRVRVAAHDPGRDPGQRPDGQGEPRASSTVTSRARSRTSRR